MKTAPIGELTESVKTWNPSRTPDIEFDYIDLSAVDNSSKTVTTTTPTLGSNAPSRARQLVAAGDVLVSTVRPNLNAVAVVPPDLDGAIASTGFTVLRPGPALDRRFLFHWVRTPEFIADMVRKATGASYPAVSDRIVKDSTIPVLPLPEQRRIAAILDHADALRAKRRQVLTHLDSLTQSIFHDMFGDRDPEAELGALCRRVTDGTHQSPNWAEAGIPFLFVSNITTGEIEMTTKRYISETTWQDLTRRTPIEVGDVLYSTVGSYGIPAVVRRADRFAFQRHLAHLKPDHDRLDSDFLAAQLASSRLQRQAARAARGIAQPTVNLADIKKFQVVAPPLLEQQSFSARVRPIRGQKDGISRAMAADEKLFASLQSRAFRGEL